MSVEEQIVQESPITAPANGVAEQSPPPETPAALTPGEAAKEARLSAELRARQQRMKAKSDALFQERKRFEEERKAHAESMAAAEKKRNEEIAALQAELKELKSGNPLLRKDVDANSILREFVAQGTPEAEIKALKRELEAQRAAFEERFASVSEATKRREEEEQRRLVEVNKTREENTVRQFALWATTGEQATAFKHLNAEFTQDEVYGLARQVNEWAKSNGKTYTGREVAAYLEKHAESVYKKREERRQMYLGATPPATPAVTATTKSASLPATGNGASRNKFQVKHLSREQEIEADLALLRKATQADAASRMPPKKK